MSKKKHRKAAEREARQQLKALRKSDEPRRPDTDRLGFVGRTAAGVYVTPDRARRIAAVWACVRYLSQTVGMLPWNVMQSRDGKGAVVQSSSPLQWLIHNRPSPEWSSFQFRETLINWALLEGNGYAEIERDRAGRPAALWPIHPDRVEVLRDAEDGQLFYRVDNGIGTKADILASDIFHLRGFGDGPVGVNVVTYAAESLGWAQATQMFGASFFGNGANVSGVVISKRKMDPDALKRVKAEFNKLYKGIRNANQTAFLDGDMDWKATGIDPEKSQLVELNHFQIEEICRWFGVPPHKIAHLLRATFSNIEHQSIEVVQDSVMPWVRRLEDEADYKLFGQNRAGLYTKIELRGLLRGDFKSQQEGLEIMRRNGLINGDEWRELVDMAPMPANSGGEKFIVQSQYTTLEKIGEEPPPPVAGPPQSEQDAQDEIDVMAEEEHAAA